MTHSLRHLILFTSVASSCLLAAGTPSMPAAEALKERARAALPKDWQITSFQEGIVPDGWASSDSSCVKLVAEQGNKKVTFWLLPLDWVGVRLKSANSRPPGKPVYVSSRDYRGIFHLADLSERLICRGMYAWPGRYHDSVYPPDTWPELNELINKLILEHCPTDAARDEAARSLLDLGIPAPALIRDRAENSRAKDRDRFIRYLPRYAGPKALPLLRRLMLDAEDKATRKAAERSHRSVLARIAYDEMGSPAGKKPWPQEAQISYEPERKVYLLGEPILVDFVVKNTGKRPFAFYEGQDSRCAARNLRFRFVATDEAGDRVRDPYPFTSSWGGVLLHNFLMPGESYRKTLDLRRWCAFVCPGVYRVTGGQILGWDSEEKIARRRQTRGPHPVGGRFNITIREPDRATMEALVEKKDAGDRPVSAIDCYFKLLHAPAYVPILKAMLKDEGQDRQRTLRGLAGIQTHEVTRLFIDQMKSDDWKIRIAAAREVFLRLPARVVHGEVRRAFHYRYYTDEEWAPFIARVWSERMREPIRRIVRKSLMELPQWKWKPALTEEELLDPARERTEISRQLRDDYLRIVHEIIQILGDVDDVECLKQAINVLARERRNAMDLVRLAVDLQLQGAAPLPLPGEKSTTADWLVWLELKGRDTKELRQKYSAQYEMAISNTNKKVQTLAFKTMPTTLALRSWPLWFDLILDHDLGGVAQATLARAAMSDRAAPEQRRQILARLEALIRAGHPRAFIAAADCGFNQFNAEGLEMLRQNKYLSWNMVYALDKVDPQKSYIDNLLDRMDRPKADALRIQRWLTRKTLQHGNSGINGFFPPDEIRGLKRRWQKWFAKNREIWLKTGPLPKGDPRLEPRPLAQCQTFH